MVIGQAAANTRIAIVGAGMAGMTCAQELVKQGLRPTVFEKSRGLGGRLATRRGCDGVTFDHGAQYVTARSAAFRRALLAAEVAGAASEWRPRSRDPLAAAQDGWYVGAPAMNALVKPLARGIDLRLTTEVSAVRRERDAWHVVGPKGHEGEPFDIVVCTAPAPQARRLLASEPAVTAALAEVEIAPCWALMLRFTAALEAGFDVLRAESEDITWVARNGSKPGREPAADAWVVHAGPEWSRCHLELERDQVARIMVEMLPQVFGLPLPEIESAVAHRWRYARTTGPLGAPFLSFADRTLFLGGDWCLGARVECAFESGCAIAQDLMAALRKPA